MSREPHETPTEETRKTSVRRPWALRGRIVARLAHASARLRARWRMEPHVRTQARHVGRLVEERHAHADEEIARALQGERQRLIRARLRRNPSAEFSALAHACVLAARTLGLAPHAEQILGAVALLEGQLIEMATGEGKTLTLALASVPAALGGRVHMILTANDYLAARDAATMGPLYARCGLRVGAVTSRTPPAERRQAYACDVVYTTARELVADHLRDRLQYQHLYEGDRRLVRELFQGAPLPFPGVVLRGLDSVFVDEADYVLIDEAVTPLIISAPQRNPLLETLVAEVYAKAGELQPGRDFAVQADRGLELTRATTEQLEQRWSARHPVLQLPRRRSAWVRKALEAMHLMVRDRHYLVRDGKVQIIDQTLGRILPDRSWSHGMHQLIELKERVPLSPPTNAITSIGFQRFFQLVPRLAGASGTLAENAFELYRIYGLGVVRVPLHRPDRRRVEPARVFLRSEQKFAAALDRIGALHGAGQPILVGTLSVRTSEHLARLLRERGLPFRLLNAAQDRDEAEIIARAGEHGAITVATNMAGRGVDIRLGAGVESLGGLCVVQLERNPARRVDRQLYGRCARQGERGRVEIFTSIDEDHLAGARRRLPRALERVVGALLASRAGQRLAEAYVAHCQNRAERRAHAQRIALLRRDRGLEETIG